MPNAESDLVVRAPVVRAPQHASCEAEAEQDEKGKPCSRCPQGLQGPAVALGIPWLQGLSAAGPIPDAVASIVPFAQLAECIPQPDLGAEAVCWNLCSHICLKRCFS